ncbi:MAG: hypothetical protein WCF60_11205 [Anaerobacillus sp.]
MIPITQQQFSSLIELVYLGNWLANGSTKGEKELARYNALEEYLLSKTVEFGLEEEFPFDQEMGQRLPTMNWEKGRHHIIEEYNAENFWESFVSMMAFRDVEREKGSCQMTGWMIERVFELENDYMEHFLEHGLDRIEVKK